jgi:hypothetical protein
VLDALTHAAMPPEKRRKPLQNIEDPDHGDSL